MKRILLHLLVLLPSLAAAQVKDLQSWTGLQLNVNLPKKFTASLAGQLRMENNLRQVNQIWGEAALNRDFNKYFSLAAGYRYKWGSDRNTHRFFVDATGSLTFDLEDIGLDKYKLRASLRMRFQDEVENIPPADWTVRPKVKLALERKKWKFTPWIAWEGYYSRRIYGWDQSRLRGFAGVDFNLPKRFELKAFYCWQLGTNTANPTQANILGLVLSYEWKK